MKGSDVTITVVIPVYGGAKCLEELVNRLIRCTAEAGLGCPTIVFVDDCGPDDAWTQIKSLAERHPSVLGIQLMRNFGQHNALMCGLRHASADIVVTMDDDLQHAPECVPMLIDRLITTDADLVYGVYDIKKHALGRRLGSWLVNCFYRQIFKTQVTVTSLRAIRGELIDATLRYDLNFTYFDGLLAWNSQRIQAVTVPHYDRSEGRSGYTIGKLLSLAMNVFTNFSLLPLQLVSLLGFVASVVGLALGGYYLVCAMLSKIFVPGYASIIVAVLVLGGLQLLSLGILGEYVGRLHLNVNRKPQYTVRSLTSPRRAD